MGIEGGHEDQEGPNGELVVFVPSRSFVVYEREGHRFLNDDSEDFDLRPPFQGKPRSYPYAGIGEGDDDPSLPPSPPSRLNRSEDDLPPAA